MKITDKTLAYIIATPFGLTLAMLTVAYEGYCLKLLWQWFITEPFGVRPITTAIAVGLATTVGVFTHQTVYEPAEAKNKTSMVIAGLLRPATALLIGYIIHRFFM